MELTMTNTTITQTKCVTFLGLLIDEKLKWDEHIKTVKQKINRSLFAINRAKHFLKRKKSRHVILFFNLPLFNIWNNTVGSNL